MARWGTLICLIALIFRRRNGRAAKNRVHQADQANLCTLPVTNENPCPTVRANVANAAHRYNPPRMDRSLALQTGSPVRRYGTDWMTRPELPARLETAVQMWRAPFRMTTCTRIGLPTAGKEKPHS